MRLVQVVTRQRSLLATRALTLLQKSSICPLVWLDFNRRFEQTGRAHQLLGDLFALAEFVTAEGVAETYITLDAAAQNSSVFSRDGCLWAEGRKGSRNQSNVCLREGLRETYRGFAAGSCGIRQSSADSLSEIVHQTSRAQSPPLRRDGGNIFHAVAIAGFPQHFSRS